MAAVLALAAGPSQGVRAEDGPLGPSIDELWDAVVDPAVGYEPVLSGPEWIVPSDRLPPSIRVQPANNNLSIAFHGGRLFLAWRSAPIHFASNAARLHVVSSPDMGKTWTPEVEVALGSDLREPFLLEVRGRLLLYFVELGARAYAFEPRALWRLHRTGPAAWSAPERWGGPGNVTWDFKVRGGRAWATSYEGKHYSVRESPVSVRFRTSTDGLDWSDVGPPAVYRGGVSEVSFEFEPGGRLWAVTRNEDGDETGFGSHVATAPPGRPGEWAFPPQAAPDRYDSPRMFRHGKDVYVVARRDLGPPIGARWKELPVTLRKLLLWPTYSLRPKRTALYRLDPAARRLVPLLDLPSASDTAFPSVARVTAHTYLIANYSSPVTDADQSWLRGQLRRTGIYFVMLRFVPRRPGAVPAAAVALVPAR